MFFNIESTDIATMTSYISGLVGDFMPIIMVILGITLAMYIFRKITK